MSTPSAPPIPGSKRSLRKHRDVPGVCRGRTADCRGPVDGVARPTVATTAPPACATAGVSGLSPRLRVGTSRPRPSPEQRWAGVESGVHETPSDRRWSGVDFALVAAFAAVVPLVWTNHDGVDSPAGTRGALTRCNSRAAHPVTGATVLRWSGPSAPGMSAARAAQHTVWVKTSGRPAVVYCRAGPVSYNGVVALVALPHGNEHTVARIVQSYPAISRVTCSALHICLSRRCLVHKVGLDPLSCAMNVASAAVDLRVTSTPPHAVHGIAPRVLPRASEVLTVSARARSTSARPPTATRSGAALVRCSGLRSAGVSLLGLLTMI